MEQPCVDRQMLQLVEGCSDLGVSLDEGALDRFARYMRELLAWNRRINLLSRQDENRIALAHFLDSLSLLPNVNLPPGAEVIDIGAGAGFPGLPLKICRPDLRLTLVESIRKKALFLRHISSLLELRDVLILSDRAETLNQRKPFQKRYDLSVARAVAKLKILVALALPFLKEGGQFVAFKCGDMEGELRETLRHLSALSCRFAGSVDILLPISLKERRLFIFRRTNP